MKINLRSLILPELDLVIARLGHSIGGGFGQHFNKVTAAIAKVLERKGP